MNRDAPLSPRFHPHPVIGLHEIASDSLPGVRTRKYATAVAILAQVFIEGLRERKVSYSRHAAWYSRPGRDHRPTLTARNVVDSIDALVAAGWLETWIPNPNVRGRQSVVWATDRLLVAVEQNIIHLSEPAFAYDIRAPLKSAMPRCGNLVIRRTRRRDKCWAKSRR